MLFFSGRAKYVHEHTYTLPFLHSNHNRSLPAEQGLTSHSHHTRNKCTLINPYLMPLEVFYQTQIIILPCMYFGCFHGNQRCVASYNYFYTWGVLQEVDIISTVRPYHLTSDWLIKYMIFDWLIIHLTADWLIVHLTSAWLINHLTSNWLINHLTSDWLIHNTWYLIAW